MKIALIGYGKMGHVIERVALKKGHEVVCRIDPFAPEALSPQEGFQSAAFAEADVAIEFTTPQTAKDNILACWAAGKPVVSGTTGWGVEPLKSGLDQQALVWSSNFSIGVQILFAMNKRLTQVMKQVGEYQPSITEVHHIHKLDKPSGTAKTLAEGLQIIGDGLWNDVPIESIREGEVPGVHTVRWTSEADELELTHRAHSREGFAQGAVLAAEWIIGKTGFQQGREFFAFLVGKACVFPVGAGIFQVNFLMRHIHIPTHNHWFLFGQFLQVISEILFPVYTVIQALQTILRIRNIHINQIEIRHFHSNHPTLMVMFINADTVGHIQGRMLGIDSRSGIAFLVGIVPIRLITNKFHIDLAFLQFGFLQAEEIGIERLEDFGEALSRHSAQAVYIPTDKFHRF